ncbi:hypothetical protein BJF83_10320 [Nocardiopsis sp. CNR-923]|uniref:hypothetical protein n=1 Tax=Nocardiopsis sp. CNR-923 TaxID=1904965 RepID=UPI000960DF1F|nr:hypothetical protein [Nocardiopsis sp. CNR-923]OLT29755.1 hypothetical protein BJF83_10320 [Nocardiopsis sp. CNR-923]
MRYLIPFLLTLWPPARAVVRPPSPVRRLVRGVVRPRRAARARRYARPGPALPSIVLGPGDLLRLFPGSPLAAVGPHLLRAGWR